MLMPHLLYKTPDSYLQETTRIKNVIKRAQENNIENSSKLQEQIKIIHN